MSFTNIHMYNTIVHRDLLRLNGKKMQSTQLFCSVKAIDSITDSVLLRNAKFNILNTNSRYIWNVFFKLNTCILSFCNCVKCKNDLQQFNSVHFPMNFMYNLINKLNAATLRKCQIRKRLKRYW